MYVCCDFRIAKVDKTGINQASNAITHNQHSVWVSDDTTLVGFHLNIYFILFNLHTVVKTYTPVHQKFILI